MATVYLAHDVELDRHVAVKVLRGGGDEFARRFRREAMTAAGLAHPNIVAVFDVGEEADDLFIVMEYVDGESLDVTLAREGRVDVTRAVAYADEVCDALAYAHERGVVHRDVKPANLLLRRDGTVKVTDFGIARADGTKLTQPGTVLGTAAYIAPEQARGEEVGPGADLFSLGVVLYELLAGSPPWRVTTLADVHAVGTTPPPPLAEVAPATPAHVEAAVARCLAADPRDRPTSADELAEELRGAATAVTAARTDDATRPTALLDRRPRRLAGRRVDLDGRTLLVALVAALILIAAIAALAAGGEDEPPPAPARVEPVTPSNDPVQQSRNLAEWLREHAADG